MIREFFDRLFGRKRRPPAEPASRPSISPEAVHAYWDSYYKSVHTNMDAFLAQLPELLLKFPGEFVAIANGSVVDHSPDEMELAERVAHNFPETFVLIEKVEPREKREPVEIPSIE